MLVDNTGLRLKIESIWDGIIHFNSQLIFDLIGPIDARIYKWWRLRNID